MEPNAEKPAGEVVDKPAAIIPVEKPIVEKPAAEKPVNAPVVEEEDDNYFVDEKPAIAGEKPNGEIPAQFDRKRFAEVDEDLVDAADDKLFERLNAYKTKYNQVSVLAQASELIENDEPTKTIKGYIGLSDEDLVLRNEIQELKNLGYTEEQAAEEAAQTVKDYKEESPTYISKQSRKLRIALTGALNARKEHIATQIKESRKALSLSEGPKPEFLSKSIEHLGKTKEFLGLKFGSKTEQGMKDFIKPIETAIKDGSFLKEIQSDPQLLAELALYRYNRDGFKTAITKRVEGAKTKAMKGLADAPYSDGKGGKPASGEVKLDDDGKPMLKNPGGFK